MQQWFRDVRYHKTLPLFITLLLVAAITALASPARAGESQGNNVDAFYGSYQESVEISVPPFRGIEPKLGLSYNSSGGNGFAGVGWSLEGVSTIERAGPGKGVPTYTSSDIYLLDGQELVPCSTMGGTHCTKIQSYLKIIFSSNAWTIWQKDGTKTVLHPVLAPGGYTVRWGVVRVSDTKDNTVYYTWAGDGGNDAYLNTVTYNGVTITIHREIRPDPISFATGKYLSVTRYRPKTIDVTVSGSRLRAYKISYTTSTSTSRSLLASVQQFGRDATIDSSGSITGDTSLPATTVTSPNGTNAFAYPSMWLSNNGAPSGQTFNPGYQLSGDFNGDGKLDYMWNYYGWYVALSNGNGFDPPTMWLANNASPSGRTYNPGYQFVADFNGDGKDDFMFNYGGWYVALSTGSGFSYPSLWLSNTGAPSGQTHNVSHQFVGDFNGDGKDDFMWNWGGWYVALSTSYGFTYPTMWLSNTDAPSGRTYNASHQFLGDFNGDGKLDYMWNWGGWYVALSTGTGFTYPKLWLSNTGAPSGQTYHPSHQFVGDFNGDGKTDYMWNWGGWYVALSTGTGFTYPTLWLSNTGAPSGQTYHPSHQWVGDFNGDGKLDYMWNWGGWYVALSTGNGFTYPTLWLSNTGAPNGRTYNAGYEFVGDFNGDGKADFLWNYYGWYMAKSYAPGDLATTFKSPLGGSTTITYTPSSSWPTTNNPPVTQTVSSVRVLDGRGASATTQFSYSGGLFDAMEKRFMGFRYAKTTQPCITGESACPYTEVYFKQDYGSVSKPEYVYQRDGSGKLQSYTAHVYSTNWAAPYTSLEVTQWEYAYDASNAYKRTAVARTYDAYGNITQENMYGDQAVSGDEKTIRYQYYPNPTTYVVGKPAAIDTFAGLSTSGALLAQSLFYYDGNTTWQAAPTAGKGTKTASWVDTTNTYVTRTVEYDVWGNVTAEIDELGNRVSYTIDPTYNVYVTGVTNALGQTATAAWDVVCGVRTSSVDMNGLATSAYYDNLCRPTLTTLPGGGFETRGYYNLGSPTSQYVMVFTPAADASGQLWTRTYLDGLGRTWRTETKGPAAGKEIRNDVVYDARGNSWKQTLPYYANEPAYWVVNDFDALDRPIKVTYPDGKIETRSYGLGLVTSTDEVGNQKTERTNAWGQVIERREKLAGTWHTTYYSYNLRGQLQVVSDPVGNFWIASHDSLGRRTRSVDPDTGTWDYEYDAAGRQVAQVDAKGQRTEFTYDAIGRRQTKTSAAGTPAATTVTWQYDQAQPGYFNAGKLTAVTDPSGAATYDYDESGRLVRGTRTVGSQSFTFTKGYDASGRLKWTSYPDGDSMGTPASPLVYDGAGRLIGIPGVVTSATYNAAGELTQHTNANGTVTTKARSALRGWLTSINTTRGSTTLQNLVYSRDEAGRITSVTSPFAYEGWSYSYDELNRLTSATNHGNAALNQTFAYDVIGNMTSNSRVGAYGYAATGQARPHAVTTAGTNQYAYDANGNMVTGTGRSIEWDADNRPVAINSTTYSYDAEGARLTKTAGGVTTYYVGDDYEVTEGLVTKYIALAGTMVAKRVGSVTSWIHTDHQGTIQLITDASGNEVQRLKHRAYGERFETATGHAESRGYTGKRLEDSGLIYLHARYYDPVIGRFISPDPTIPSALLVGLNRYAYAANNPITFTDVDGLGLFKKIKKAFKKLGKAITKVVNAVSKVPVIGGVLRIGVITALGPLYGIATGDWKGMVRAHATAFIMVVAAVLTTLLPPAGAGLWSAAGYVAGSAAIGFGSGAGIAIVNGASVRDALKAGMTGAAISGGLAVLRSFYMSTVKMTPGEYNQFAESTTGVNDGGKGFFSEGSKWMVRAEKIPGIKAISGVHDWIMGTLDYVTGQPVAGQKFYEGLQFAQAMESVGWIGKAMSEISSVAMMPVGAVITYGAMAAPFSPLIVGQQTLAHDYRRSARSVSSTGWLGNASGQPFGLAPAH